MKSKIWSEVILVALTIALMFWAHVASAQLIQPTGRHYAIAIDQIAMQRAHERILRAERVFEALVELARVERQRQQTIDAYRARLVRLHAARIRAWHGMAEPPVPGDGYIVVHR